MFPPKLCRALVISILYIAGAIFLMIFPKPLFVDIIVFGALSITYFALSFVSAMDNIDWSAVDSLFRPYLKRILTARSIRD